MGTRVIATIAWIDGPVANYVATGASGEITTRRDSSDDFHLLHHHPLFPFQLPFQTPYHTRIFIAVFAFALE